MSEKELLQAIFEKIDGIENKINKLERKQENTETLITDILYKFIEGLGRTYQSDLEKNNSIDITVIKNKIAQIELLTTINKNNIELQKLEIQELKDKIS